jgi:hypothetical protein
MGMLDKAVFSRALNTNLPVEIARTLADKRDRMCVGSRGKDGFTPDRAHMTCALDRHKSAGYLNVMGCFYPQIMLTRGKSYGILQCRILYTTPGVRIVSDIPDIS